MNCDEVQAALSAYIDDETPKAPIDAHVASCRECRAALEAIKADDVAIGQALDPFAKQASRSAEGFAKSYAVPRPPRKIWSLAAVAATALFGFIAAMLIYNSPDYYLIAKTEADRVVFERRLAERDRTIVELQAALAQQQSLAVEFKKQMSEVDALRDEYTALAKEFESYKRGGLGRLTHLIGGMEVAEPNAKEAFVPAYIGMPLSQQTIVRTAPGAKATFYMTDGSELRLNEGTEIRFVEPRQIRLDSGEIWAQVKKGQDKFQVHTRDGRVEVLGTEIDVRLDANFTILLVFSGTASMTNGKMAREVKAGEAAIADKNFVTASTVAQMERAIKWTLDLLVARGRDNPELNKQITHIFEMMGQSKVEYMTEDEIKSYGSACTIPIARYLETPQSRERPGTRLKAVRILADIGDWYAVDAYLKLLNDPNPEIRQLAGKGLQRVTGQNFAFTPEGIDAWNAWWAKTRSAKVTDDIEKQFERVKKKFEK